ncbi:hypothetical protein GmHk_17G049236 [Glycine max]|nr:hypothetical protein GmHk_17G049236 [Glycine max]
MACSPRPMFVDYVKETWTILHKEKFVSAWTNKVMHLGNTTTNRVESTHSSLKRLLQNSLGGLCTSSSSFLSKAILGGEAPSSLAYSLVDGASPILFSFALCCISMVFEELDVCGKFTLKTKLWEIAYPNQNLMCPPPAKVNTKGAPKKPMSWNPRSTKRDPSY